MKLSSPRQPIYLTVNTYNIFLLSLFVSWPILYVLIFTTQPKFILGDTDNFLLTFASGTGLPNTDPKGNLTNTILSDKGRQTVLWVSFLISLLISIFIYLILQYIQ